MGATDCDHSEVVLPPGMVLHFWRYTTRYAGPILGLILSKSCIEMHFKKIVVTQYHYRWLVYLTFSIMNQWLIISWQRRKMTVFNYI